MLYNWYQHIFFAYPWVLPLLLILPYIVYWYVKTHRQQTASLTITTTFFLQHTQNWKTNLRHLPIALRCLALAVLIIALARPQQHFTENQTNGEGIDIVLCFDISGSMTEQDFRPNRIEAAKEVAANFVQNRPGDRIGVVIFSSQSFTLCPITPDHKTVLRQISNIENGYLPEDGTAIGSGLATSVDRLRNSTAKSKVVILLTDGVDHGGLIPPDIAKKLAITYGIKVYCIGIGSEAEMDVQVNSALGTVTEKRKMSFDENLLKQISAETGGQYYQASNKAALKGIYDSINQLEKSKIEITTYNRYTDEYLPFLVAGLLLILLELIMRLTVLKKFP